MTNFDETEDILASIRRLVADSHIPRTVTSGELKTPFAKAQSKDQSTLNTQELAQSEAAASDATSNIDDAPLVLSSDLLIAQEVQATPAGESTDLAEEEGNLPPLVLGPEQAVMGAASDETPWPADFDDTPEPDAASHVAGLSLEERIAELEQAIGAVEDEWEPDGSLDLDDEIPHEVPRAFTQKAVMDDHAAQGNAPKGEAAQDEASQEMPVETATPLGDNVHVLGSFGSRAVPNQEHAEAPTVDAMEQDDLAPVFPEVDDFAPAGFHDDPSSAAIVQDGGDFAFDDELPEVEEEAETPVTLDEAALRAVVADVLGEELRGHLGERMTRNIRRLVRREVQRALAMRDLS
ncbi:hypothetical protein [Celeribacter sp.]|uniref:hypothetical protein n=1 Tax=Celeribacter sp. TaxID=1890673 RepID=UPI003A9553A2